MYFQFWGTSFVLGNCMDTEFRYTVYLYPIESRSHITPLSPHNGHLPWSMVATVEGFDYIYIYIYIRHGLHLAIFCKNLFSLQPKSVISLGHCLVQPQLLWLANPSALVGRADFRKLELKNRSRSGNCQCLSENENLTEHL